MNGKVDKALGLWGMEKAGHSLAAARENRVYRIEHGGASYVLRLHRKGYRTDDELLSELLWMGEAERCGMKVPRPIASSSGKFFQIVDGTRVDMLTWLPGQHLATAMPSISAGERIGLLREIGREMARLHRISDAWEPPEGFTRQAWDRKGLLGEKPVWNRFWENPSLTKERKTLLSSVRAAANEKLAGIEHALDYGLIHADIIGDNVLVENGAVRLIDFDDGGYGFRLFELATLLFKLREEEDYEELRAAMLEGYRSLRALDDGALDLFILLRSLTYVGWIMTRMEIEEAEARNAGSIHAAVQLSKEYLEKNG